MARCRIKPYSVAPLGAYVRRAALFVRRVRRGRGDEFLEAGIISKRIPDRVETQLCGRNNVARDRHVEKLAEYRNGLVSIPEMSIDLGERHKIRTSDFDIFLNWHESDCFIGRIDGFLAFAQPSGDECRCVVQIRVIYLCGSLRFQPLPRRTKRRPRPCTIASVKQVKADVGVLLYVSDGKVRGGNAVAHSRNL